MYGARRPAVANTAADSTRLSRFYLVEDLRPVGDELVLLCVVPQLHLTADAFKVRRREMIQLVHQVFPAVEQLDVGPDVPVSPLDPKAEALLVRIVRIRPRGSFPDDIVQPIRLAILMLPHDVMVDVPRGQQVQRREK